MSCIEQVQERAKFRQIRHQSVSMKYFRLVYCIYCTNDHYMSPGKTTEFSGGSNCWDVFCLRNRTVLKMFLPFGSLWKVTKRGLGIAGVCGGFAIFCTTGFVDGDLNDNHRMFLNIEVIFCMKPELVELVFPVLFPFPPVDNFLPLLLDIDTKVDFFFTIS